MHLVFVILLLISSCKSGDQRKAESYNDKDANEIVNRIETIKQVYHLCPSPAEMIGVIDVSNLHFDSELLNPLSSINKYSDTRSKSLALGIYATDMAYAALFARHEETIDYLDLMRHLAEEIEISDAISEDLFQKVKDNVEEADSLRSISNEAFVSLLFYCERTDSPNTFIMISAGAFVESLYLAVKLADDFKSSAHILSHISDQKYALDNLILFGESLRSMDPNIEAVLMDLRPLQEIYRESETLNPGDFEKLKNETIRLRTRLINS